MRKLGCIGFGTMASAIIKGILAGGLLQYSDLTLFDIDSAKTLAWNPRGAAVANSAVEVVRSSEFVLLAVKPQNFPELLSQLRELQEQRAVYISIAAGISAGAIKAVLGEATKVVTVMPNTPILVGHGTSALSCHAPVTHEEFAFVLSLFKAVGEAHEIPADKMNEIIPFNGSAPAFIYAFSKVFVDRAVELGFDYDTANRIFASTLIGSAEMMLTTGMRHQQLIDMVTSKGGTTQSGLEAMKANGLEDALRAGIDACIRRAYELGQ